MRTQTAEVTSKKQKVGEAQYPIYDSVNEAIEHEGETKLLDIINSQIKTNAMNQVRAAAVKKPSKTYLRNQAMARITPQEFEEAAGDPNRIEELIQKYAQEVEQELLSQASYNEEDDEES